MAKTFLILNQYTGFCCSRIIPMVLCVNAITILERLLVGVNSLCIMTLV